MRMRMIEGRGSLMNLLHRRTPFALAEDPAKSGGDDGVVRRTRNPALRNSTVQQACH
jgi:hypothetical protein